MVIKTSLKLNLNFVADRLSAIYNSALMLMCARLRYAAGKDWGYKRNLCMACMDYASE